MKRYQGLEFASQTPFDGIFVPIGRFMCLVGKKEELCARALVLRRQKERRVRKRGERGEHVGVQRGRRRVLEPIPQLGEQAPANAGTETKQK